MTQVKAVGAAAATLLLVAAVVMAVAVGARAGLAWLFDGVDPGVSTAIVAATATVVVSVISVTVGRYLERRHQIEVEIRERKIPVYNTMITGLLNGLFDSKDGNTAKLETQFRELTPQLMTWASDDVIKAWKSFKIFTTTGDADPIQVMFVFENVLKAVRQDLGHKSTDLAKGDLLSLFVTDIHEHLPAKSSG